MHHNIRPVTIIARLLLTIAALGAVTNANAETRYLDCVGGAGEIRNIHFFIAINFDTQMVSVTADNGRTEARADISDSNIAWQSKNQVRTEYWNLNRINGNLMLRGSGVSTYKCTTTERPSKRF
jgi:hypothetical protein